MKNEEVGKNFTISYLVKVFICTIKLNVWDINFFFSDQDAFEWSLGHLESPMNRNRKGFFPQLYLFTGRLLKRFFRIFINKRIISKYENPLIFVGFTKNQIDSLSPLFEKNRTIASIVDGATNYSWNVLTFFAYIASLIFFPCAILDYIRSRGSYHEGIKHNFAYHWLTYGLYFVIRLFLRKSKIKSIVLANDHNMDTRVIIQAAKDEGKITFYIQHASVTRVFPSLNVDFALLEGIDALGHYEGAGASKTKVFLIGSPKFDKYYSEINNNRQVRSLGICVNLFDPIDRVKRVIENLKTTFPDIPITLRIHPGQDKREYWEDMSKQLSISYSESLKEGVFDFLKKVDAVIAGNSNVHLDAALLNVFPIYFDFSSDPTRLYYTFIKNGLCEAAQDEKALSEFVSKIITEKKNIRVRAKVYCDTVNSEFDGCSGDLASGLILEVLQSNTVIMQKWEPITNSPLNAYRLLQKSRENLPITDVHEEEKYA